MRYFGKLVLVALVCSVALGDVAVFAGKEYFTGAAETLLKKKDTSMPDNNPTPDPGPDGTGGTGGGNSGPDSTDDGGGCGGTGGGGNSDGPDSTGGGDF
ncbi:MAG: hypothetical protein WA705_06015 [Candidatus Ozemobacteraceae bacterium]